MLTAVLSLLAAAATPAAAQADTRAPNEIVAAAPASEWVAIAPRDLLVMDLAPDRDGKPRRVVIQLMRPPFSAGWIGNIRKLAAARWWDGTSVNRVQDNYVVQWGDAEAEDKAKARPLPAGLAAVPQSAYAHPTPTPEGFRFHQGELWSSSVVVPASPQFDPYPAFRGVVEWHTDSFDHGFAVSSILTPHGSEIFPVHCYGAVGVGRDMPPDTGSGAELYAVIGQAPRHLDRNIAVVGRVIEGIEHLSSLPRGTGDLGFYTTAAERVPIVSVRIGDQVAGLPRYEYLSTESPSFARYADARASRRDPFFIAPAGGADICNVPVPVRRVGGSSSG